MQAENEERNEKEQRRIQDPEEKNPAVRENRRERAGGEKTRKREVQWYANGSEERQKSRKSRVRQRGE